MTSITQLRIFSIVLIINLIVSGCGILPIQFTLASTAADVALTASTGKSSTEHVASEVTKKDCQWSRLFSEWKVCLSDEEYVENLMIMNCHTYAWNFLNIPYCKENE